MGRRRCCRLRFLFCQKRKLGKEKTSQKKGGFFISEERDRAATLLPPPLSFWKKESLAKKKPPRKREDFLFLKGGIGRRRCCRLRFLFEKKKTWQRKNTLRNCRGVFLCLLLSAAHPLPRLRNVAGGMWSICEKTRLK